MKLKYKFKKSRVTSFKKTKKPLVQPLTKNNYIIKLIDLERYKKETFSRNLLKMPI